MPPARIAAAVVIDLDQTHQIHERGEQRGVRDDHTGGQIRIVTSAEHDAERVHERGIERKVGVVARHHRAISIARDGKICTGIPARGRVEQRIGGRVAHVRAARRSRKELDRG